MTKANKALIGRIPRIIANAQILSNNHHSMNRTVALIFLVLAACQSTTSKSNAASMRDTHIIIGCQIYDSDLNPVRTLPSEGGNLCWPFPDGSWVSGGDRSLIKWTPDGEKKWEIKGSYHHQIRIDEDQNVIALTREYFSLRGRNIRVDKVQKISPNGKILAEFKIREHLPEIYKHKTYQQDAFAAPWFSPNEPDPIIRGPFYQMSHINAIQVITENQRNLATGEKYIINEPINNACFSLDSNLQFAGWLSEVPHHEHDISMTSHDCQRLQDQSVIYFRNEVYDSKNRPTFRITRRKGNEILFRFPKNVEDEDPLAETCGGAELLIDGNYLVSVVRKSDSIVGFVDASGHWIKKGRLPYQIQDAKVLPDENFLERNLIR